MSTRTEFTSAVTCTRFRAGASLLAAHCCWQLPGAALRLAVGVDSALVAARRRRPIDADSDKPAVTLLNVSYDPTRELYAEFNKAFAKHWQEETGQEVTIEQSHGGAGHAGPRGHRRPEGRRRDAGHRLRHRPDRRAQRSCCPPIGRTGCRTTAAPTPRRSCSWFARATRRGSRTGTTW